MIGARDGGQGLGEGVMVSWSGELTSEETPGKENKDETKDRSCDDGYDNDSGYRDFGGAGTVPRDEGRDIGHSPGSKARGVADSLLLVETLDGAWRGGG